MLRWQRQGKGPHVVLVHGFLGSGKIFEPLTEYLAPQFTVTTIDLPGHGDSYDLPMPATVEELTLLVSETIQSSGIDVCSILGHSLGAMIALEMSLLRPSLLDKMVIYGGCPDGLLPNRFETTEESVHKVLQRGVNDVAKEIASKWFKRGEEDPMYPFAVLAGSRSNQEAAIISIRSWDHWFARARLGAVQTPALIICGDSDLSTHPDNSIEMWKRIPQAQLFIAPNAGHAVHLEYTEEFNSIVAQFLK